MSESQKVLGLLSRAKILRNTDDQTDEVGRLQDKLREIKDMNTILVKCITLAKVFEGESIDVDTSDLPFSKCEALGAKIRDRYDQEPVTSALTIGRDWRNLVQGIGELEKEFERVSLAAWQRFTYRLYSGRTPMEIEKTMVPSEENQIKLADYSDSDREYRRRKEELPTGPETFEEVRALANTLSAIEFDSNLPDEAREFLNKIHSGGIPLDQVTCAMFEWIDSASSRKNYLLIEPKND